MNGKIVELTWNPGGMTSSSHGANKYDINRKMQSASKVISYGYGNYKLIEYTSYWAKIELEDNTYVNWDVKRFIKEAMKISKMTKQERIKIEKMLPIEVDFTDKVITFTDSRIKKKGGKQL